jgi:hypothetical protein
MRRKRKGTQISEETKKNENQIAFSKASVI